MHESGSKRLNARTNCRVVVGVLDASSKGRAVSGGYPRCEKHQSSHVVA